MAHVLILKDRFAPRFTSMQAILDSMEFLENYEVILAKFSSSCCYMLSFLFFFVVFIFRKVGQIIRCLKSSLSINNSILRLFCKTLCSISCWLMLLMAYNPI